MVRKNLLRQYAVRRSTAIIMFLPAPPGIEPVRKRPPALEDCPDRTYFEHDGPKMKC
jgi:hypothetical protein